MEKEDNLVLERLKIIAKIGADHKVFQNLPVKLCSKHPDRLPDNAVCYNITAGGRVNKTSRKMCVGCEMNGEKTELVEFPSIPVDRFKMVMANTPVQLDPIPEFDGKKS